MSGTQIRAKFVAAIYALRSRTTHKGCDELLSEGEIEGIGIATAEIADLVRELFPREEATEDPRDATIRTLTADLEIRNKEIDTLRDERDAARSEEYIFDALAIERTKERDASRAEVVRLREWVRTLEENFGVGALQEWAAAQMPDAGKGEG